MEAQMCDEPTTMAKNEGKIWRHLAAKFWLDNLKLQSRQDLIGIQAENKVEFLWNFVPNWGRAQPEIGDDHR